MQPTHRDAVKRVLSTAGITGAALTLSAAAALPAFACPPDDGGGDHSSAQAQHKSDQHKIHQHASSDRGAKTQTSTGSSTGGGQTDRSDRRGKAEAGDTGTNKSESDSSGHNPPGNNGTVFIHQV